MAGAGKTTVGKALSSHIGYKFLDTDKIIENLYGKSKDIIDSEGQDRFRAIEEEVLLSTKFNETLLATGGSAVFSHLAMKFIGEKSYVIYLEVNFETILDRVSDFKERGFIKDPNQTVEDAYKKREILYKRYSDHTVTNNRDIEDCVQKILTKLKL